jgi:uncharacterized protein (DUF433 family)
LADQTRGDYAFFIKLVSVQRDADVLGGVFVFNGTRATVQTLFDHLERSSLQEFLDDFPTVTREQALSVLEKADDFGDAQATSRKLGGANKFRFLSTSGASRSQSAFNRGMVSAAATRKNRSV